MYRMSVMGKENYDYYLKNDGNSFYIMGKATNFLLVLGNSLAGHFAMKSKAQDKEGKQKSRGS